MDTQRLYTVEDANRTLPLVRRIVRDIVQAYPAFERHARTLQRELAEQPVGAGPDERLEMLREQTDEEAERLNEYIRELQQLGCTFKGFEDGLVDFYSVLDGRPIMLCWKLDEERIGWWHEVDGGYAGRQPLTPEIESSIARAVTNR